MNVILTCIKLYTLHSELGSKNGSKKGGNNSARSVAWGIRILIQARVCSQPNIAMVFLWIHLKSETLVGPAMVNAAI